MPGCRNTIADGENICMGSIECVWYKVETRRLLAFAMTE